MATAKARLHERCFACDGDAIFSKFVASPARGENHACSHSRASAAMATAKKSQKKYREKLNELNFSGENRRLCCSCSHHRAPATRQFPEKIASPSQAKNRSCSRGLNNRREKIARSSIASPTQAKNRSCNTTRSLRDARERIGGGGKRKMAGGLGLSSPVLRQLSLVFSLPTFPPFLCLSRRLFYTPRGQIFWNNCPLHKVWEVCYECGIVGWFDSFVNESSKRQL